MQYGQNERDRFRSFAERYVVERASTFNSADPREDAWRTVQDAISIYDNIAQVAHRFDPVSDVMANQQATVLANPVGPPPPQREWKDLRERANFPQPQRGLLDRLQQLPKGFMKGAQHGTTMETPKGTKKAVR